MEREKGREMITTECEYERENCSKVVTKWLYKYHFSKTCSVFLFVLNSIYVNHERKPNQLLFLISKRESINKLSTRNTNSKKFIINAIR